MSDTDFCSLINLSGLEKTICQTLEKSITPNVLQHIFSLIEPKLLLLTNGIEQIIQRNAIKIFLYDTIILQLPWLITFFILVFVLWISGVIKGDTLIILFILAIIVTAGFIALYLYLNKRNIDILIYQTKAQLNTNISNFKKSVFSSAS